MFRHSEIHSLLRQRAAAKEHGARKKLDAPNLDRNASQRHFYGSTHAKALPPCVAAEKANPPSEDEENEEEYQRFLIGEREQFTSMSNRISERRCKHTYTRNRTRSTRRVVRELDDIHDTPDTLDYGDGDATSKLPEGGNAKEGRKIWWPELGSQERPTCSF